MIEVYDTTLRDGMQNASLNLTLQDKIDFALELDGFGIDYIELGWPGSNPSDTRVFEEIQKYKLQHSQICAFGSTRKKGIKAKHDSNLNAIVESEAGIATIFGKSWVHHVKNQLGITPNQNLESIADSIGFLKSNKLKVFYDAEHFFDGFKDNPKYALKCLEEAFRTGADVLVLCDTNGGSFPDEIKNAVIHVKDYFGKMSYGHLRLGIHCHNDRNLAVANSCEVSKEINQIQGTVNGFGDRAGNADLCSIIPNLFHSGIKTCAGKNLQKLTELSRKLYELANIEPSSNQPFVGPNAFSEKSGIHLDGRTKGARYFVCDPGEVGNDYKIILSQLSGKAHIVELAREFGFNVKKDNPLVNKALEEVKSMASKGYDVNLEAEKFLLAINYFGASEKFFEVTEHKMDLTQFYSTLKLKVSVNGHKKSLEKKIRGGPVDAYYHALQEVLSGSYPSIKNIELANYRVKNLGEGAESAVRVSTHFMHKQNGVMHYWATVGVSKNVLEASLETINKGFNYYLLRYRKK